MMWIVCEQFRKTCIYLGGFEYFKVPSPNLQFDSIKIPNEITFEEATLIEPVACGIRAINKCKIKLGDIVAVVGSALEEIFLPC